MKLRAEMRTPIRIGAILHITDQKQVLFDHKWLIQHPSCAKTECPS